MQLERRRRVIVVWRSARRLGEGHRSEFRVAELTFEDGQDAVVDVSGEPVAALGQCHAWQDSVPCDRVTPPRGGGGSGTLVGVLEIIVRFSGAAGESLVAYRWCWSPSALNSHKQEVSHEPQR